MTFIVETGSGTPNANAYTDPTFVTAYLTDRARETENSWSSATTTRQQQAIVAASDYVDKRFGAVFKGIRLRYRITGRVATGTITFGGIPVDAETIVIGQMTYRFVAALAQENDVLQGATASAAATNLAAAVNGTDDGTLVHEDTRSNLEVAATVASAVLTLTAPVAGVNGNQVAVVSTVTGVTLSGATLSGGLDTETQPREFPRSGAFDADGNTIVGVPLALRQAVSEYAVRAVSSTLDPDPTVSATGATVQRTKKVVGPIESEVEYVEGAPLHIHKPYPAADRLLAALVYPARVYR